MMNFQASEPLTYGLELELQIVDPRTGRLHPGCLAILDELARRDLAKPFATEATLATIELNSSVHRHADEMQQEVRRLVASARESAQVLGLDLRGGGTHLAQFWNERVMAPTARAELLTRRFGFLPKRFSTYGMHVHVGMPDADAAIRVANVLQALCPLLIALSAASPYLQLSDTGFAASRPLESLVYPHGGPMPFLGSWQEMRGEVDALCATGLAQALKDIYWDVRPKPEFGTVEVRVFDTPLSVNKALRLAGLTRELAGLALADTLQLKSPGPASALRMSRFAACREGLEAQLFDPMRGTWLPARQWLSDLLDLLESQPPLHDGPRDIRGWRALLTETPEYVRMRDSWHACQPEDAQDDALQAALAAHSGSMSAQLLG